MPTTNPGKEIGRGGRSNKRLAGFQPCMLSTVLLQIEPKLSGRRGTDPVAMPNTNHRKETDRAARSNKRLAGFQPCMLSTMLQNEPKSRGRRGTNPVTMPNNNPRKEIGRAGRSNKGPAGFQPCVLSTVLLTIDPKFSDRKGRDTVAMPNTNLRKEIGGRSDKRPPSSKRCISLTMLLCKVRFFLTVPHRSASKRDNTMQIYCDPKNVKYAREFVVNTT